MLISPPVTRLRRRPFTVTVMFSPTRGWAGSIVTPFSSLKVIRYNSIKGNTG